MSAIPPVAAAPLSPFAQLAGQAPLAQGTPVPGASFEALLANGLKSVETKIAKADEMVKAFALDDSIPVHQVTFALEQARLSVELAIEVRTKLLEGYRELMNMQL